MKKLRQLYEPFIAKKFHSLVKRTGDAYIKKIENEPHGKIQSEFERIHQKIYKYERWYKIFGGLMGFSFLLILGSPFIAMQSGLDEAAFAVLSGVFWSIPHVLSYFYHHYCFYRYEYLQENAPEGYTSSIYGLKRESFFS